MAGVVEQGSSGCGSGALLPSTALRATRNRPTLSTRPACGPTRTTDEQDRFLDALKRFIRTYAFLSQVVSGNATIEITKPAERQKYLANRWCTTTSGRGASA